MRVDIHKTTTRRVKKTAHKVSKKSAHVAKKSARHAARAAVVVHHHSVVKPHQYLTQKSTHYDRWHRWRFHGHVHYAILVFYLLVIGVMVFNSTKFVFAADITDTWNFSTPGDFTYDSNNIETSGSSARLKAQNYASDGNTAALYHFDESSGTTVNDDSANNNDGTSTSSSWTSGNLNNAHVLDGNDDYLSVPDSSSLSLTGQHSLEAWTKFNSDFSTSSNQDQGIYDKGNYKLYYDRTSGRINYEIASNSADSWTRQAGNDANNSWDADGKNIVRAIVDDGTNAYYGLGLGTGDAEVWRWSGSAWTKIGGDGVNSSWADQVFEDVNALAINGTTLYAGLGTNTAGDGEVWSCNVSTNCTSWTKIGGDGLNSGWAVNTVEGVFSLSVIGSNLFAGVGNSAGDGDVWRWNGTSWTQIGGDGLNSGWAAGAFEAVRALENDGTNLYAGLGDSAQDAEVWRYNGTTWTRIGGDGVNSSWATGDNIEQVLSLDYFGGNLYAGTGLTAGDGDVWRFNGTSWTKIGGDGVNSGWAASTYEVVPALENDGTNLYAALGNSNGDGEVFRWNGTAWTKIGGDGVNSGFSANEGDGVYALQQLGSTLHAGLYDAAGDGQGWTWNGSAWTIIGGGYINQSWGGYNSQSVESSATHNEKLYVGTGVNVAGNALVWEFDGDNWTVIGGQGIKSSWARSTYENVHALQSYKGNLYAALGTSANDAEVWKYNGTTWSQVGGDSLNSGWTTNFEGVYSLTVYNGLLCAGLGNSAQDAEVWCWNDTSWTRIGGDGVNSSWAAALNMEVVFAMATYRGQLYAALGNSTGDAEIWAYNGSTWTKVGGDGLNSSWNTSYEENTVLRVYNDRLITGLGNGTGDADLWSYNGSTWTRIGGSDVNGSWTSGTYERVKALNVYNGELYVGVGETAGDGEVWKYNGTSWSQVGGDGLNSGWTNVIEYVSTLIDYKGKLYAGTGFTGNQDAAVWSYGNNAFLSSAQTSQNTDWHHIAATYNGNTMKIFIDGTENATLATSVTIPDNSLPLLIGSTYGSGGRGEGQGYFAGRLDEARISSIARTSFTTKPYTADPQTISLTNAVRESGVLEWDTFSSNESANGGAITYRVSDDGGTTWKYWDGDSWEESTSTSQTNAASVINSNIATFPVTFDGITWQAVLDGDGNQQVTLNEVAIGHNQDADAPSANASAILAYKSNGGASISSGSWSNAATPYFSWTAATDAGSGIKGYCLYLGTDNTADPVSTKGLLGSSPGDAGGNCQFMVTSNNVDLGTTGYLASALTTSNSNYYLNIKAIDNAGNVFGSSEQFTFKFDNTPPSNPGFISAPSGFINTKAATLTWPTSGGQEASDANSGLAGLQYRINNTTWYGDSHTGSGDISDLLTNDGSYATQDPPDYDNINEGVNTVYFRTWDQAGNVTSTFVSAALKVNTNGAPSEPQNVSVTPSTNTTNSFAFDWDAPATFVGDANNLTYCYTINAEPTSSNCTFTSGGVTSLGAGPYATQPGSNTFYVVARDESSNINYDNYSTATFNANTPSPGIPTNVDIVDVSIKSTSNWRLALTWEPPEDEGAGIASYKIYRSTDNSNFSFVGSSSSTTYIDANLSQQTYYYYARACDSTNNCGANSTTVSLLPTGKFTTPATLTAAPTVSNVTTKKARISWSTDRTSDSKVAIGTSSGQYSPSEVGNSSQVTAHTIDLDNLAAGTTYYFKAKWTDEDGNTGTSQEYSFTTAPAPVLKEVVTSSTTLSGAVIQFTSKQATKVNIYYGKSESFGGLKSVNTSQAESTYTFSLTGLDDGSKYFYKLSTFDEEGNEYEGNIFSFTTPPRPKISNLRFQPVEGRPTSTQKITWETNVPTSSQLVYGLTGRPGIEVNNSALKTKHEMIIKDLQDDSEYYLLAQGRDKDGNLSTSDRQVFKTAEDTRPPNVENIAVEVSIKGTGAEARGQVVVSWVTDEPSTSQVAYAEGSDAVVFNNKSALDEKLSTEHLVIVSDLPTSKLYSVKPLSKDKAGNEGGGETQSAIVGKASDSVLTIILTTLQRIFGF